jgi:hypothetical protein
MQKDAHGQRSAEERASFERGLAVMGSLYASLSGTTVLRQRDVPSEAAEWRGAWNGRPYDQRGWTVFEQGVASAAEGHMERVCIKLKQQGRTAPDAVRRAERPKLVDIGTPATTPGTSSSPEAHLREVTRAIGCATFTAKADSDVVLQMLYSFEWTMHSAMEAVLARRGGSAELTTARAGARARVVRRDTADGTELLTRHGTVIVR